MIRLDQIEPGDVLCTRNPKGWQAFMIRLGAAFGDDPNTVNHVIVAHHRDQAGRFWGIEARPGGVGWIDLKRCTGLKHPYTIANHAQPKSEQQRVAICNAAEGLLGTPYSWADIAKDAMEAISAQDIWKSHSEEAPAQIVCSALADWVYDHVGLASPGARYDRTVTPGDWARWITERGWRR